MAGVTLSGGEASAVVGVGKVWCRAITGSFLTYNLYQKEFIMSLGKLVIEIYMRLYDLYLKIQGSSEDIKGWYFKINKTSKEESEENKQKIKIGELIKENNNIRKDIHKNSKSLDEIEAIDYLYNILTCLSEYLSATCSNLKIKYYYGISTMALLETAKWIRGYKNQYLEVADIQWLEAIIEELNKKKGTSGKKTT
jgi:hypothetical protein